MYIIQKLDGIIYILEILKHNCDLIRGKESDIGMISRYIQFNNNAILLFCHANDST